MAVGNYPAAEFHKRVWRPQSLAEAWRLKQALKDQAVVVAGGTLLRTQWESGTAWMPPHLLSLEQIPELGEHSCTAGEIHIGAGVSLENCRYGADTPQLLKEACRHIAAPSIRRMGTLGGNVLSQAGDSLPALLVSGAELVWYDGISSIVEPVEVWTIHRKAAGIVKEQRILTAIRWSRQAEDINKTSRFFYEKVGRREGFCPSIVTIAGGFHVDSAGRLHQVRLAAGSAAAMAERLKEAEEILEGAIWSTRLAETVHQAVMMQFEGGSDSFASAIYRKRTAANLIVALLWNRLTLN